MLNGARANPYEITEAEALLARWAGLPSRIGYGWYGGVVKDGWVELHPIHGSTWLEVWFQGYGWVPIVGYRLTPRPASTRTRRTPTPRSIRAKR